MSLSIESITAKLTSSRAKRRPRAPTLKPAKVGDPLIPEEMELLMQLCKGFSAMDVIRITRAEKRRVYYIRDRIMLKADCSSEVELGVWAAKQGIV